MLYEKLDREFSSRTRFFAAAALTNSVLAQLFTLLPRISLPAAHRFLYESGGVLEAANIRWAHEMRGRPTHGTALDHHLVNGEQRLMQFFLDGYQARVAENWAHIRRELNSLLNRRHVASLCSNLFARSRSYEWILAEIRRDLGVLDFGQESHRIRIGMGLIHYIRCQG